MVDVNEKAKTKISQSGDPNQIKVLNTTTRLLPKNDEITVCIQISVGYRLIFLGWPISSLADLVN